MNLTFLSPAPRGGWHAMLCALGLYAAAFGCLCSLGGLGPGAIWPLLAGAAAAAALPVLKKSWAGWAALGLAALGLVCCAAFPRRSLDGLLLYCNRLFAASEANGAYLYERFAVTSTDPGRMLWALLPAGLFAGTGLGLICRKTCALAAALLGLSLTGLMAWLGLLPQLWWLAVLAAALLFALLRGAATGWKLALPLAAAGLVLLTLRWLPGPSPALTQWSEAARDRLALQTVAYADRETYEARRAEAQKLPDFTPRPAKTPDEAPSLSLKRPAIITAAILLSLVLLFVPAWWADRLKRRREQNRLGLFDPDRKTAAAAGYVYALRWLKHGGLDPDNRPYAALSPAVAERFPALAGIYPAMTALFYRAAYSPHPVAEDEAAAMAEFVRAAQQAAEAKMSRRARLHARYVEGL